MTSSAEPLPLRGSSKRAFAKPRLRRAMRLARDRLARRLATAIFLVSIFVAALSGVVSLAVGESSVDRETRAAVRDAMGVAVAAIERAGADVDAKAAVVDALAAMSSVAAVRLEQPASADATGPSRILEAVPRPSAAIDAELAMSLPADATLVVAIDRERIDDRLAAALGRQLVAAFIIAFAAAAASFYVNQFFVTRHVERVADALDRQRMGGGSWTGEAIVLDRPTRAAAAAPDTLDRLVSAANALLALWRASMADLRNAHDDLERKVAERTVALDNERERFRDVAVASSDWVFETDARARIVFLSGRNEGRELEEWLRGDLTNLRPLRDAPRLQADRVRAVVADFVRMVPIKAQEIRVAGPDGTERRLLVTATPIHADGAGATPVGMRGCISDHTELALAHERVSRSERNVELGRLTAAMAHEINTPAGVSLTYASAVADIVNAALERAREGGGDLTFTVQEAEDIATSAAGICKMLARVAELIASFKQVVVDQVSEQRRVFSLKDYLEEVRSALATEWKKKGQIDFTIDVPSNIHLDSYPGAIFQVVTNLVTNALHHAFANAPEHGRRIALTGALDPDGETVTLVYQDNGCGLMTGAKEHIFAPFFTTKRASGGTGLGLSIVHSRITELLGGTIRAEEPAEGGFRLVMRFPRVGPDGAAARLPGRENDAADGDR